MRHEGKVSPLFLQLVVAYERLYCIIIIIIVIII